LPRPDFVTASHVHTDHLDGETLRPLARAHPGLKLVLPWPVLDEARRRLQGEDARLLPLDAGERLDGDGWSLQGVAAAHNDLATDAQGRHHYLGFILRCGPFTLYHSGDTLWHAGLVPVLRPLACDLMLLPVNGNRPERRVAGNLNGIEAAALARACAARLVLPCNTESPDEFVAACKRVGQPQRVLRCGGRLSLDPALRA
jgi:L-ascorbate metabolism protein UlaG (beta-lactamase superfamily)